MKKSILIFALAITNFIFSQVDKKYNAGLGLSIDPVSANNTRYGPALKFDYNLTKKFGVGVRGMGVFGTWQGFTSTYATYTYKYEYKKGRGFVIGVDAIYHAVGNNQDSKFGLRVEGGIGFGNEMQSGSNGNNRPATDSSFYSYDFKYSYNNVLLKIGIGADYKIGPGKVFVDIPIYSSLYQSESDTYSNQKVGPGTSLMTDRKYTSSLNYGDLKLFLNIGYQMSF